MILTIVLLALLLIFAVLLLPKGPRLVATALFGLLIVFAAGFLCGGSSQLFTKPYVLKDDLKLEDSTYFFRDNFPGKAPVVGVLRKGNQIEVFQKGDAAYVTMHTVISMKSLTVIADRK